MEHQEQPTMHKQPTDSRYIILLKLYFTVDLVSVNIKIHRLDGIKMVWLQKKSYEPLQRLVGLPTILIPSKSDLNVVT